MARSDRVTKPHLPSDEATLTREDVAHMLDAMPAQMVLVGGQALAFWMDYYGVKPGAGAEITVANTEDCGKGILPIFAKLAKLAP